ncbi:MAG: SOS response-associated peptidase family protein [Thomasclavelia sp.]|nr:SOS response-associated peptidase family protein [Thomasclavelia sp.]
MCGTYYLDVKKHLELHKLNKNNIDGDIFPGNKAPVVIKTDNGYQARIMTWGYKMRDKLIYNARSETVLDKDFFISIYFTRCLVPVSGYYEFSKDKTKYSFSKDKPFYLAGIYKDNRFCIITTNCSKYNSIHSRMPLILEGDDIKLWLSDDFNVVLKEKDVFLDVNVV